jgi:HD-GYP domain-containing protein (c-di-GMP phosphodiesterase class II)
MDDVASPVPLAGRIGKLRSNAIRDLLAVTQRPDVISMAGGLPAADVKTLWRAASVKEIGRTGISSSIWEKTASLTEREWERVRLHTYYVERIFARTPALAKLGALASLHHERMDGTGYHRGLPSANQSLLARILRLPMLKGHRPFDVR